MIKILKLGTKFVPSYFSNLCDIFTFIFYHLDSELVNFNMKFKFFLHSQESVVTDNINLNNIETTESGKINIKY
jgi:hypothetical protein